jgi:hypothetical protein
MGARGEREALQERAKLRCPHDKADDRMIVILADPVCAAHSGLKAFT